MVISLLEIFNGPGRMNVPFSWREIVRPSIVYDGPPKVELLTQFNEQVCVTFGPAIRSEVLWVLEVCVLEHFNVLQREQIGMKSREKQIV